MEVKIANKDLVVISEADLEIMTLYASGKTISQIAKKTKKTNRAVDYLMSVLRGKFRCRTSAQLVAKLMREKIIE